MKITPDLIAVYGTLRAGHGSDYLWANRAAPVGIAHVAGFRLFTPGGFPYAMPTPGVIVVELLRPHDEDRADLLADLDGLEGVRHDHYERRTVTATLVARPHAAHTAWMYVPTPRTLERLAGRRGDWLHDGDWANYRMQYTR